MKGTVIYHAPVGDLQVDWEDGAITALKRAGADVKEAGAPNELTEQVFRQLDEYFAGTRRRFDFPYRLHGTPFQEKVWAALRGYSLRRDAQLQGHCGGHRPPEGVPRGGHGQPCEPDMHRRALPPRHRRGRRSRRLRRRAGHENGAAGAGKGAPPVRNARPSPCSQKIFPFRRFSDGILAGIMVI